MTDLSQGDFSRLVRGGPLDLSEVELFLLGMASQAKAAAKRVHRESAEDARDYLDGCMAQHMGGPAEPTARSYLSSLQTYIEWDATAEPAEPGVQPRISFEPDGTIRGRADIVFDRGAGQYDGRLLLWDDLPMDRRAAEIIALPSLRAVEHRYGDGSVRFVEVWQLATRQGERVDATSAEARTAEVHEILRQV